jgi:hypothetical protein
MIMRNDFIVAGQITTGHSDLNELTPEKVATAVNKINDVLPIDILCIGWREIPDLYFALTGKGRVTPEIYLWYPLLSDYPGIEAADLVINHQGKRAGGWGDFPEGQEIHETFMFGCPNNPQVLNKTLGHLEYLLTTYAFDGVFLDKLRFPSPANSFDDMLSCFCSHCQAKAQEQGLDLEAIRVALSDLNQIRLGSSPTRVETSGLGWLDGLLEDVPLLQQFLQFRAASITEVVQAAYELAKGLNKKVSLDVFSPSIAPLVGQDYRRLRQYAEWVKPMSYRFTKAPASLRFEAPALAVGIAELLSIDLGKVNQWAKEHVLDLGALDLGSYREKGVPQKLFATETLRAVDRMAPVPVFLGLETVHWPGLTELTSKDVFEMMWSGREVGVGGVCLSWDLLHTPMEYIVALKKAI